MTTPVWRLVHDLLAVGDLTAVAVLRRIHDADALGHFAAEWYHHPNPAARRVLLAYLDQPLNAPRHEALVKRLFKLAEATGDDEVMGRFLVLFDRSTRRTRQARHEYQRTGPPKQVGYVAVQGTPEMPRNDSYFDRQDEDDRKRWSTHRLFTNATRAYLRRRAWRYFRQLGKTQPERYFAAVQAVLPVYRDGDLGDGLALLDNWGLVHILFHDSSALLSLPSGWTLRAEHTLAELKPAPIFAALWHKSAEPLLRLLAVAQARPIRQWAIHLLEQKHAKSLAKLPLATWVDWLMHPSGEMVRFALGQIEGRQALAEVGTLRWLQVVEQAGPELHGTLIGLALAQCVPAEVPVERAVALANRGTEALARFGLALLQKLPPERNPAALAQVANAEHPQVRAELVRWAVGALRTVPAVEPSWIVTWLDSRHAEVRAAGWEWLLAEPRARDEVGVWRQLLESPYDEVRGQLIAHLETQAAAGWREQLDPVGLRTVWASVLLNVARGGKAKPTVLRQLLARLRTQPAEANVLVPVIAVAVRSLRGPEFRAGLVTIVQLLEEQPSVADVVREVFPELKPAALVSA